MYDYFLRYFMNILQTHHEHFIKNDAFFKCGEHYKRHKVEKRIKKERKNTCTQKIFMDEVIFFKYTMKNL